MLVTVRISKNRFAVQNLAKLILGVFDLPATGFRFPHASEELFVIAREVVPGFLRRLTFDTPFFGNHIL